MAFLSSLGFLCRLPFTLTLEGQNIALQEDFSRGDFLASQLSRLYEEINVLTGNFKMLHCISHAHEFGKFLHSVIGLTSYAIADVCL